MIESYTVTLPHSFEVSFILDKRAPLALSIQHLAAPAKIERQEPLVLKVSYPWYGYVPPSKGKSSPQTTASGKSVRTIAGRVVDHEGKPVADAHVWWMVFDHGFRKPTVLAACRCDAAGRFRLEISSHGKPPATRPNDVLWALAPGKQTQAVGETEKLQFTDEPATSKISGEVVIHLDPAPDFSFQVNDAADRPVSGAAIERLWCGQHFPGAFLGELPDEPEWPAPFHQRDLATTDALGVVHFSGNSDQFRITTPDRGIQTIYVPAGAPRIFPIGGKARPRRKTVNHFATGRPRGGTGFRKRLAVGSRAKAPNQHVLGNGHDSGGGLGHCHDRRQGTLRRPRHRRGNAEVQIPRHGSRPVADSHCTTGRSPTKRNKEPRDSPAGAEARRWIRPSGRHGRARRRRGNLSRRRFPTRNKADSRRTRSISGAIGSRERLAQAILARAHPTPRRAARRLPTALLRCSPGEGHAKHDAQPFALQGTRQGSARSDAARRPGNRPNTQQDARRNRG